MRRLFVIGSGATAERLSELGGAVGYDELRLTDAVPDDLCAEDHLIVAEEDPRRGQELLLRAAQGKVMPAYLGYAASHREGWKALIRLAAAGVPKERIDQVAAPAGVDVGAEAPAEVAIAVAAELVALRNGRRRPSAGLPIESPPAKPVLEIRPRRLIGARPKDDGNGEGEGRN